MELVLELAVSLILILLSCELFVNGIEWLGYRLGLSESATGSILAAVGTALPETLIPLVAIFMYREKGDIAIGAILGAPFMLSTAAMLVTGMAVIIFHRRRKSLKLHVDQAAARRDLLWFLLAYSLALMAGLIVNSYVDYALAGILLLLYIYYIHLNLKDERGIEMCDRPVYFSRLYGSSGLPVILVQVAAALAGIVAGAHMFVDALSEIALMFNVSPLMLSLLIAPVATELPEKFNSVLWVREGKDTLAFGNITGAMVFQSTFPVSIGLLFTRWSLDIYGYLSGLMALIAGAILLISNREGIPVRNLFVAGFLYLIYIYAVIYII